MYDPIKYYCVKCDREVPPVEGRFHHPDHGDIRGKICPNCQKPVMVKSDKEVPA